MTVVLHRTRMDIRGEWRSIAHSENARTYQKISRKSNGGGKSFKARVDIFDPNGEQHSKIICVGGNPKKICEKAVKAGEIHKPDGYRAGPPTVVDGVSSETEEDDEKIMYLTDNVRLDLEPFSFSPGFFTE